MPAETDTLLIYPQPAMEACPPSLPTHYLIFFTHATLRHPTTHPQPTGHLAHSARPLCAVHNGKMADGVEPEP